MEGPTVLIHPVALFAVIDSYERRPENSRRVIGTLMGKRDKLSVEVKSAFCVPHSEKEDEVAVNTEFAKEMMELHQKVAKESIVGWFATGGEITGHSVLIHDFYSRLDKHVVHVTIDTTLRIGKMEIKAYIKSCIGVPGKTDGTMFTPVPCEVTYYRPERVAGETFH
jgi:translation initiation factor 3 subunit F